MIDKNRSIKKDKNILEHLTPYNYQYYRDTYFCNIYYKNKDIFMYTITDKAKEWVESNGGTFKILSDKKIIGERKGFVVQITFPTFNQRDMKNIMATLY